MAGRLCLTAFDNEAYLVASICCTYTLWLKLSWFGLLWICWKFVCKTCWQQI